MNNLESEVVHLCHDEWKVLGSFDKKYFCQHTLAALSVLYFDADFLEMNDYDKNLLL